MDPLFIEDGYTKTHTIAAVKGLHPAVEVLFRPALPRERHAYIAKLGTQDADQIERYESEAIAKYVKELNGQPVGQWKEKISRIAPAVRVQLMNVIFGYSAAQVGEDAKN